MSRSDSNKWPRRLVAGAGCLIAGVILLSVAVPLFRLPSKMQAPHALSDPRSGTAPATPVLQLESHTCGLLSLSAAYASYGLSPDRENLRFRLGVDRPANPLDESTTGTLHPDFLRVLIQDNFEYEILDPEAPTTGGALRRHFDRGDAALFLIARRENGNLHWVMSDAIEGDTLRVVDSLAPAALLEPLDRFLSELALSIIAIRPRRNSAEPRDPHAEGLAEMARVRDRMSRHGLDL